MWTKSQIAVAALPCLLWLSLVGDTTADRPAFYSVADIRQHMMYKILTDNFGEKKIKFIHEEYPAIEEIKINVYNSQISRAFARITNKCLMSQFAALERDTSAVADANERIKEIGDKMYLDARQSADWFVYMTSRFHNDLSDELFFAVHVQKVIGGAYPGHIRTLVRYSLIASVQDLGHVVKPHDITGVHLPEGHLPNNIKLETAVYDFIREVLEENLQTKVVHAAELDFKDVDNRYEVSFCEPVNEIVAQFWTVDSLRHIIDKLRTAVENKDRSKSEYLPTIAAKAAAFKKTRGRNIPATVRFAMGLARTYDPSVKEARHRTLACAYIMPPKAPEISQKPVPPQVEQGSRQTLTGEK